MSIEIKSKNNFRTPALIIIMMAVSLVAIPVVAILALIG